MAAPALIAFVEPVPIEASGWRTGGAESRGFMHRGSIAPRWGAGFVFLFIFLPLSHLSEVVECRRRWQIAVEQNGSTGPIAFVGG